MFSYLERGLQDQGPRERLGCVAAPGLTMLDPWPTCKDRKGGPNGSQTVHLSTMTRIAVTLRQTVLRWPGETNLDSKHAFQKLRAGLLHKAR